MVISLNLLRNSKEVDKEEHDKDRRSFLKKIGASAVGLGFLASVPSALASIEIRDADPVRFFGDDNIEDFSIHPSGKVEVRGNEVWHEGNDGPGSGLSADNVAGPDGNNHSAGSIPMFNDPSQGESNTSEGDIFYSKSDNSIYLNDGT